MVVQMVVCLPLSILEKCRKYLVLSTSYCCLNNEAEIVIRYRPISCTVVLPLIIHRLQFFIREIVIIASFI